ncbi:MAG: AgmX/PglI C-terminal domain-containing protein [Fluviicoccus sp.]|uniref:AgmX/PglI C-terminal domain-containing protein n=1 Tax=Fluviicoccus sp. TaxID=2003552 RepID=UPI0027191919|nr:AgmX/PglI C-terminal domain-containing protein [Fluviicoccus sp.]MDO8330744.1 AgmX/PglI C-terminal domain-containing protein [Fluviicoccus sp.]
MSQIIQLRPMLPWDDLPEDASRKRRIDIAALVLAIILCLIVAIVKLPKIERKDAAIPERIARMVERKEILPPPPPPVKKEEKKEEKKAEDKPADKPKPVEEKVAKVKPTDSEVKTAKEKASKALEQSGVTDALADLRDMQTVAEMNTGGALQKNSGQPVGTSRNMINSRAGAGSGGLAYQGAHSSGFGGGVAGGKGGKGNYGLGGKGTTDMKGGVIASVGGGGRGEGGGGRGEGGIGKRTTDQIRSVFDRNQGKLFGAYTRAMKDDPSMEGRVLFRIVIDPNGSVTSCEIVSSELNNSDLESRLVTIVKSINFGEDNVDIWKGTFPLNFYPK